MKAQVEVRQRKQETNSKAHTKVTTGGESERGATPVVQKEAAPTHRDKQEKGPSPWTKRKQFTSIKKSKKKKKKKGATFKA